MFAQVLDYARSIPLYDVQITILTPFPGTPLYDRLRGGIRWLTERLYGAEETAARRKPFFERLRRRPDHRPAA